MLAMFVAVLGVTGYFYMVVPKGFIPDTDNDNFSVNVEAAQGTSYYQMVKYQQLVSSIVVQDPDIESFYSMHRRQLLRPSGASGRLMVNRMPRRQRKATVADIVNRLRPKLSGIPGLRVSLSIPQAIRVGGRMSKSAYDFTLYGPDTAQLYEEAPKLERIIARLPGLQDVTSDLQIKTPRVNIVLDRDRAAALHLNWNTISSTLYDAFGPQFVFHHLRADQSVPRAARDAAQLPAAHRRAGHDLPEERYRRTGAARARWPSWSRMPARRAFRTPASCLRSPSRSRSSPAPRWARPPTTSKRPPRTILPATITGAFQGTAKVFQDSMRNMGILLIVAIAVVYIVLGVLYESYVHPLTILSGLPSAGFGALLTLILFKVDLSIYSFVGLIMLIGIVKKNAIMQIDFALEAERKEGMSPAEAIYRGLPDPLPPHHDDHHGGAAGRPADRARLRRRRRSAPAARPGGGRRPGVFAVDDSVSDPGGLHLHGGHPRQVERRGRPVRTGRKSLAPVMQAGD